MGNKDEKQEVKMEYVVKLVFVGNAFITSTLQNITEKGMEKLFADLSKAMWKGETRFWFGTVLLNPANLCYAYVDHSKPIEETK